jgi:3-isopropylmalate/(R)-2-methylmalate dehydratase small subunit
MAAPSFPIIGPAVPFGQANVDTDLIIPARYMRTVTREGLGAGAFEALRGIPGNVFDDPRHRGAPILIAGANFGCGSSREHAVWALLDLGLRAVIAPSFGEIFEGNALNNGLLAIRLDDAAVAALLGLAPDQTVTVDVERQQVAAECGRFAFALDPIRRESLLTGRDDIALTLAHAAQIDAFERRMRRERPWIAR